MQSTSTKCGAGCETFLGVAHYWINAQDAYVLTLIGLTEWDFLG